MRRPLRSTSLSGIWTSRLQISRVSATSLSPARPTTREVALCGQGADDCSPVPPPPPRTDREFWNRLPGVVGSPLVAVAAAGHRLRDGSPRSRERRTRIPALVGKRIARHRADDASRRIQTQGQHGPQSFPCPARRMRIHWPLRSRWTPRRPCRTTCSTTSTTARWLTPSRFESRSSTTRSSSRLQRFPPT